MNNDIPYEGTIEFVYEGLIESACKVANFPKTTIEQQVVYKLRHKHTGLFYHPNGTYQTVSKLGKVYSNRRPARQSHITIPYDIRDEYDSQFHNAQTKLGDWEVISYTITEIKE